MVESKPELLKTLKNLIKDIDNCEISIEDKAVVECTQGDTHFEIKVRVTYTPGPEKIFLEFESFREYLKNLRGGTIEEYCERILEDLVKILQPTAIFVEVSGETDKHGLGTARMWRRVRE